MAGVLSIITLSIMIITTCYLIAGVKRNLYQYENIRRLGLLIFLSVFLVWDAVNFVRDYNKGYPPSFYIMVMDIKSSVAIFATSMFPVAFFVSIMVTASNVNLLLKEGKTWKNMLGLILGGFLCISTILMVYGIENQTYSNAFPSLMKDYLLYLYALFIAYLECILYGTIIMGLVAAEHIPRFDKDYMIILGCQIRKDGGLTPLLKSRVDKAVEFALMQKDEIGKAPVFVVSGGQGDDESISEADAMRNYLTASGIEDDLIITETRSQNTKENIRFSTELIKKENENARIAFSTTNYHVFRTGNIACEMGIDMEGIGARTKSYFWINAFIREFIATLISEKKKHMIALGIFAIVLFLLQLYVY